VVEGVVVVTGGAGFLGSWLCRRLLEEGYDVLSVDDHSTGRSANVADLLGHPRFTARTADVCDGIEVDGPVAGVMHLASPASPPAYQRLAVETLRVGSLGTFAALELARRTGARFVLASTSEVYGDPLEHPQSESYWGNVNPVGPRSMYDEAKRFSEAATATYRRAAEVDTGIVRIFNTYGPRMDPGDGRVVPNFISQALRGEPMTVFGDGSQTRSLCHVRDTVGALVAMLRSDHPGPVNIGNPHEVSMSDLATEIAAAVGVEPTYGSSTCPVTTRRFAAPTSRWLGTSSDGSRRSARADGLAETVAWFRSEGIGA
jgi:dTDP-glucose 4,6-dehydratase